MSGGGRCDAGVGYLSFDFAVRYGPISSANVPPNGVEEVNLPAGRYRFGEAGMLRSTLSEPMNRNASLSRIATVPSSPSMSWAAAVLFLSMMPIAVSLSPVWAGPTQALVLGKWKSSWRLLLN